MLNITNGNSSVGINKVGAELKSFQVNGNEIVWQSDPEIWDGSAPILFPVVGRLKKGKFTHDGKDYLCPQHGFVKGAEFVVEQKTEKLISLITASDEDTKKYFPFDFVLRVIFSIENDILTVKYEVENMGSELMYFSLGSHPAISLPLENSELSDYYIEFEEEEFLFPYKLVNDLLERQCNPYLNHEKIIKLNKDIFNEDALIFTEVKSRNVFVKNDKTGRIIKVGINEAPDLGIWAKPAADYVCIEPWFGHDDPVEVNGILKDKPGIVSLPSGEKFTTEYTIEAVKL